MAEINSEFQIPNTNDADWLVKAKAAFKIFAGIEGCAGAKLTIHAPGYAGSEVSDKNADELVTKFDAASGRYITHVTLSAQLPVKKEQRQSNSQPPTISIKASRIPGAPTALAKLEIVSQHIQNSEIDQISLITSLVPVRDHWQPVDPVKASISYVSPDSVEYLRGLEEQFKTFSSIADQQTNLVTEALRKQAIENEESRKALQSELEEEYKQRHLELDKRATELDLADSKTARRKIREGMRQKLDVLSKNLKSTEETRSDRRYFFGFIIGGLVLFGVITVEAGFAITNSPTNYFAMFRMLASSVLFSGVLIFALRWQANWIANRTKEELRLLNTSLDVERASWVLESLIELKTEEIQEMPSELLEAVTRNLFSEGASAHQVEAPLNELADILQQGAKSVKIKLGENEVELDASALKKIIKASDKASRSAPQT